MKEFCLLSEEEYARFQEQCELRSFLNSTEAIHLKQMNGWETAYAGIREDGRLIATGGLISLPIPPSFFKPQGRNGYILNMYTVPEKRHQGYAAKVLQLLQEKAKEAGFEVVYLRTSEWGRPAYEKAGFAACDDWMDWTVR